MPADHLTSDDGAGSADGRRRRVVHEPTEPPAAVAALEPAVLAVLAGTPPTLAASRASIPVADLVEAAERYQAAGRAALDRWGTAAWHQVQVEFLDGHSAEHVVATRLAPRLQHAEASGALTSWWYIRKAPYWRLRLRADQLQREALRRLVADALDDLLSQRLITTWSVGIYEPETCVFGGPEGIAAAHRFFHADSVNVLEYLRLADAQPSPPRPVLGRRELSLLLCAALLRAAGQDWHEQGDVWHRVRRMRPLPPGIPPDRLGDIAEKVQRLLMLDTDRPTARVDPHDPLTSARSWLDAASHAGRTLGDLARAGTLRRGLRDVLAHHVIFHWNRLGLTAEAQATLAHTAAATILDTVRDDDAVPGQPSVSDVADA